jgi:hypothetical protein
VGRLARQQRLARGRRGICELAEEVHVIGDPDLCLAGGLHPRPAEGADVALPAALGEAQYVWSLPRLGHPELGARLFNASRSDRHVGVVRQSAFQVDIGHSERCARGVDVRRQAVAPDVDRADILTGDLAVGLGLAHLRFGLPQGGTGLIQLADRDRAVADQVVGARHISLPAPAAAEPRRWRRGIVCAGRLGEPGIRARSSSLKA